MPDLPTHGPVAALVLWFCAAGCTGGELVTLGSQAPSLELLNAPRRLTELCAEGKNDNPTLTGDLREIYFSSTRPGGPGGTDVWFAQRASVSQAFGSPQLLKAASSSGFDSSPAISLDGLTLWVGSERDGGFGKLDVWETTRQSRDSGDWSTPSNVTELNSPEKDLPRPLGQHGQIMPLSSQRDTTDRYATYFAPRLSNGSFARPALVAELNLAGRSAVDAFLTEDGLVVLFNAEPAESEGDLYWAWRSSTRESFGTPQPLMELNTPGDERDPWLSPDGDWLFFSADRDGMLCPYEVAVRFVSQSTGAS